MNKLVNKRIHLISMLQLAGFWHIIKTLWEVSDKYYINIIKVVYKTLQDKGITNIVVCRGLY